MFRIFLVALFGCAAPSFAQSEISRELVERAADPLEPAKLMALMFEPEVSTELGMPPGVYQEIAKANIEINRKSQEATQKLVEASQTLDPLAIQKALAEQVRVKKENEEPILEMLDELCPPTALARVKQIARQVHVRKYGLGNALLVGRLGAEVGIDSAEIEELRQEFEEFERERRLAIEAVETRFRKKILSALSSKQRAKYEEMIGEEFTGTLQLMKQPNPLETLRNSP